MLSGCLGAGRLQKNEYLLIDQYTVGNKDIQDEELAHYYLQPTNRKLLGIPFSLWIYEIGNLGFDSLKIEQDYHRIKRVYNKKLSAATKPKQYEKIKNKKTDAFPIMRINSNMGTSLCNEVKNPLSIAQKSDWLLKTIYDITCIPKVISKPRSKANLRLKKTQPL